MESACGGDVELAREVHDLLACHADGRDQVDEAAPWMDEPAMPERIGPYRLLERVGQGGMGIVYRAQNGDGTDPKTQFAIKVLRRIVATPQVEKRFNRETAVLRRLDHPGIAHLVSAGSDQGLPYIATEFIEGSSLTSWRTDNQPSLTTRLRLLADLCDAVHFAHTQGVVHRDLKPENILVTQNDHPKILDFGIARLTENGLPTRTLATQTWQLLGTIRYMSPEQASGGPGDIDACTDIYALGVIAFELLAGELPYDFHRFSTPRALLEITTAAPRRLNALDPSLSPEIVLIVHHALEKRPGDRYQTAAEMAADLRRHLAGQPISLRRPRLMTRLRGELRARPILRRLVLFALISALAVTATLALTPRNQVQESTSWSSLYALLEEADQLRHSGPSTRENYLAAANLFLKAKSDLARLPVDGVTPEFNRYIRWRLGELHFFIGQLEHDPGMLEWAYGYWFDALAIPWIQGAATEVDSTTAVRLKMLRIGKHHLRQGFVFSRASLARYRNPRTNWREAVDSNFAALDDFGDGHTGYQDETLDLNLRAEDHGYLLLNLGKGLASYGAIVDSTGVVDRGLAKLKLAEATGGLASTHGKFYLDQALGFTYLVRAEISLATGGSATAPADLDSARNRLDLARDLSDVGAGREHWQLCRLRGHLDEVSAGLAVDAVVRRTALAAGRLQLQQSFLPLQDTTDDFELAESRADLAGIEALLAAEEGQPEGFARADSLLDLAEDKLTLAVYPIQFAETKLQRGRVNRLRWEMSGDVRDSLASANAFQLARGGVSRGEYPSLHRRIDQQEVLLMGRIPERP